MAFDGVLVFIFCILFHFVGLNGFRNKLNWLGLDVTLSLLFSILYGWDCG